ncbi:energy transducer TonB [Lysobacter sp. A6]|uniref:Energy transducer TonB n=1 Tax=Noviluteimonas lactosilytica TaxID=2888523 RepID=A0ABS8JKK0_9GAMM|nr:energy transducer TonB [Lysobacter lactosilyticus]MCC8364133.1 energy transducer TonB [Lysobacter lactosilyticus]
MHVRSIVLLCALGIVAPAFAGQDIDVVEEGGIRDKWMLKEGVPIAVPVYPPAFAPRKDAVCVSVGYLLKADGTTSDYTLLKAWNSASGNDDEPADGYWMAFASAAGDALAQWRFQPRPEVKQATPVYTVGTFVFGGAAGAPALRDHCRIANLTALLRDLRGASGRRVPAILAQLDLRDSGLGQR